MPVITVQMHKVDQSVKTDLIRNLTAIAVETTNIPASSYTIIIQEVEDGNIGIGGKTLVEVKSSR
jgi:4-oxalocrotonate tautomerase